VEDHGYLMGYVAKAPLVIVRTQQTGYVHVYDGEPVPEHADPKDVQRLAGAGFLADTEGPSEPVTEPGVSEPVPDEEKPAKPAGNASHEAWVDYVVRSGRATADAVRNLTRDEIRDRYGR
jgi:hypothetical protein